MNAFISTHPLYGRVLIAGAMLTLTFTACNPTTKLGAPTTTIGGASSTTAPQTVTAEITTIETTTTTSSPPPPVTTSTTSPQLTATTAAHNPGPVAAGLVIQAESNPGSGTVMQRSNASNKETVLVQAGTILTLGFRTAEAAKYSFSVWYSNDGPGVPDEQVDVSVDRVRVGLLDAANTRTSGMAPGDGWNNLVVSPALGPIGLTAAAHTLILKISGGDPYGVEIDAVTLWQSS